MEPVRLQPECIQCLLKKYLDASPSGTPRAKKLMYVQRLLSVLAAAPKSCSSPILMEKIDDLYAKMYGGTKDYSAIKQHFNSLMLEKEAFLREQIQQSQDPLWAAVQYAMTGNYIDFGALDSVTEEDLMTCIEEAKNIQPNEKLFSSFRQEIIHMKRLVYMTDNCGEIVMDKLLLQTIRKMNPVADVSILVRGAPVINDATEEDAKQVGLDQCGRILQSGRRIAGIWLDALSKDVRAAVDRADVIIAKGQGNFETLNGCGLNIYYLFLCKCDMFAKRFGVPRFTGILTNDHCLPKWD